MVERRRSRRISCQATAQLDGVDAGHPPMRLVDLSVGGARMDVRTPMPVGRRAVLSFTLIDRDVSAEIEVIYVEPGHGMGVQFISLSPSEHELIRTLVEAAV